MRTYNSRNYVVLRIYMIILKMDVSRKNNSCIRDYHGVYYDRDNKRDT